MIPVFVASVGPFAGKHVVELGLAERFRNDGMRVGFFKPIGTDPTRLEDRAVDGDAMFFKRVLGLDENPDDICPLVVTEEAIARAMRGDYADAVDRIMSAYQRVIANKDVVVIGGPVRLCSGMLFGYYPERFIQETGAKALITEKFRYPVEALDSILRARDLLGDAFSAVIFNRISHSQRRRIETSVTPFLEGRGIEVCGIIPDDPVLGAVPMAEVVDALDGRVLCAAEVKDVLIERFCIGAMNMEAALRIFRRIPNKAVITGGDRPDIQLAALETSTRCLILTGNLYPNERILARAEEHKVPVVLVSTDTLTTVETCDKLGGHLSLHSETKRTRVAKLTEEYIDFKKLCAKFGIK